MATNEHIFEENEESIRKFKPFEFVQGIMCQCIKMDKQRNGVAIIELVFPEYRGVEEDYLQWCEILPTNCYFKAYLSIYYDICVTDIKARLLVDEDGDYHLYTHCRYKLNQEMINDYNTVWHIFPDNNALPTTIVKEVILPFKVHGIWTGDEYDNSNKIDGNFLLSITVTEPSVHAARPIRPLLYSVSVTCLDFENINDVLPDYTMTSHTSVLRRAVMAVMDIDRELDESYYGSGIESVGLRDFYVISDFNYSQEHIGLFVIADPVQYLHFTNENRDPLSFVTRPYNRKEKGPYDAKELYEKYGQRVLTRLELAVRAHMPLIFSAPGTVYTPIISSSKIVETAEGHSFRVNAMPNFITFNDNRVEHPHEDVMTHAKFVNLPFFLYNHIDDDVDIAFPVSGVNPIEDAICYFRVGAYSEVNQKISLAWNVPGLLNIRSIAAEDGIIYYAMFLTKVAETFYSSADPELDHILPLYRSSDVHIDDGQGTLEMVFTMLLKMLAGATNYKNYYSVCTKQGKAVAGFVQAFHDWFHTTLLDSDSGGVSVEVFQIFEDFLKNTFEEDDDNRMRFLDTEAGRKAAKASADAKQHQKEKQTEKLSDIKFPPMPDPEIVYEGFGKPIKRKEDDEEIVMTYKGCKPNRRFIDKVKDLFR